MRILIATMSLGIGGAETNIVELCRSLSARGHDITVVSDGGVFVEQLTSAGIEHVRLPLNRKNPGSLIRSHRGINRLVVNAEREGRPFDIIHAHARIPAFICGRVARRHDIRFVTTVHFDFKVTPLYRVFTDWGERQIAVSCDIKQYLIKNYGIPSDLVSLTFNGINTAVFTPGEEKEGLAASLGLGEDKEKRIIHVSRIDRGTLDAAIALARVLPSVVKRHPTASAVIVGSGDAMDALRDAADECNKTVGKTVLTLAGPRTDIADILRCGGIFVGVSRAALEAAATALPVILAGAQGTLGIFTEDKLGAGIATNFCCRGCGLIDDKTFEHELDELLCADKASRAALGVLGQETVKRHYSVDRMADDAEKVYSSLAPADNTKISVKGGVILSGYYGFGNMGDDSLLSAIIEKIRAERPGMPITVLSHRPRATAKRYGVKSIGRMNFIAFLRELHRFGKDGMLICGGGSLIQDVTSTRSLAYYLTIMRMALSKGSGVMIHAGGIGPLRRVKNRDAARDVLDRCNSISLRDSESFATMRSIGVKNPHVTVTADVAFGLALAETEWIDFIIRRERLDKPFFVIAVRAWKHSPKDFDLIIEGACADIVAGCGVMPVFVPMQRGQDMPLCRRLSSRLKERGIESRVLPELCASELIGVIGKARFVIGMRLHALIYAAAVGTPMIALSYDPKVTALMHSLGLPYMLDINAADGSFDRPALVGMARGICAGRDELAARIAAAAEPIRAAAREDRVFRDV